MDVCCDVLVDELAPSASDFVALRPQATPAHILARLPEELRGLRGYSLGVETLDRLELAVNGRATDGGDTLPDALRSALGGQRRWAFVFEWHCDQIDEVFAVADVEALLARLTANLDWNTKRIGFIAYHLG